MSYIQRKLIKIKVTVIYPFNHIRKLSFHVLLIPRIRVAGNKRNLFPKKNIS